MGIISKLFGGGRQERVEELLAKGAVIIDVRNPGEFKNGRIEGSKNIPLQQFRGEVEAIKSWKKPIVVCCASGVRSAQAKAILDKEGVEVENAGGWRSLRK